MPISEKILKEVEQAKATNEEKELMLEVLQVEDKGSFRYQAEYEAIIKKYIAAYKEADK